MPERKLENAVIDQFDAEEEQGPGGSGNHALQGYDYQVEVSIWIALDLVSANRLSDQLVLEPRSQEDLEADLTEEEPGKVTSVSQVEGYRLVVQAKRRSGDAWNEAGIRALMVHGKRRKSPRDRLAEENVRYVLVTNAAVNGEARKLLVSRPGAWPAVSAMPTLLESALPPNATGRVAIVAGKDEEWLDANIRSILEDRFRVPRADVKSCAHALREQARIRVRGAGSGVWRRQEILEVRRMSR